MEEGGIKAGASLFKKYCSQCHTIAKNGGNKIGPNLYNIIGRESGTLKGYAYSVALQKSGFVWTEDILSEYLLSPRKFIPGTKMVFAGIKQKTDRDNLVSFLKLYSA
ncbi:iso-1-cytochrome c [Entomophthora muscae]|uniref:Iso-1-cytochrome c n=2 Tax=Entomophthora muscae TaxID=34485 RepID=A0ACC2SUF1_9FUNG|nr:iso-1-cytochrome c [Entomophthora muscae]KAJ9065796.1 iso-1-cytochrome c [Entomophthora muscae]